METSKKQHAVTLKKIFSESRRVANSEKRNLVQLSLAFIIPLSLLTTLFSALNPQISKETTNPKDETSLSLSAIDILLPLGHNLVALIFSICAISSITFTALNGFSNEPTKLKAAIKSISSSFFPLLATRILFYAIVFVVVFLFTIVVMIFMVILAALYSTQILTSKYFIGFYVVSFLAIVKYLELNWFFLSSSVVVNESKWGLEALKRSKALIKGKIGLAFIIMFVLEIYNLILSFNSGISVTGLVRRSFIKETNNFNTNSLFIMLVLILVNTCLGAFGQLCYLVATTVLYGCCKESQRNEEYFSLLVNEEKVSPSAV